MENTNKSKRCLTNASYGACAEAEQFFPDGGKDVLPDTDRYAATGAGNRRIDKDNEVKYNKWECFTGVEYCLYM